MYFNLHCPISDYIGYGIVGTNIVQEAFNQKKELGLFPIHTWKQVSLRDQRYQEAVERFIHNGRYAIDSKLPCIKIWHQDDMATRIGSGPLFGWPIFELDTLSDQEVLQLSITDELIVCSEWAKQVVLKHLPNHTVHVIPLGVDRSIFHEVDFVPDKFKFFSCGKWEIRKNQDLIVDAFGAAFSKDEDVELWVSCHNMFYSDQEMKEIYRKYREVPNVHIIGPFATQTHLARIMQTMSCGVFPSRAEGWNFELLEMMACGKPVIATNYSAHTEFCSEENCHLIDPVGFSDASDGRWFHKTGKWADIELEALVEALRASYAKGQIVNQSGIQTSKDFNWGRTLDECISVTNSNHI